MNLRAMNLSALDDALIRLASARTGAVSRVSAVTRTQTTQPIDPARGTDLRWLEMLRPDPGTIPAADILRFQALVGMADARDARTSGDARPFSEERLVSEGLGRLDDQAMPAQAAPADRIVATLRHLRGVHGL